MVKTKSLMKKSLLLVFCAALCFAACEQSEIAAPESMTDDSAKNFVKISATHEVCTIASRTELQNDGSVLWANNDQIKLVWKDGSVASEKLSLGAPAAKASFQVALPEGAKPFAAVYPAAATTSFDGSVMKVTVPDLQSGLFKDAAMEIGLVNPDGSVALKNIGCILKVDVASADVNEIRISAYGGKTIAGNATVFFGEGLPVVDDEEIANPASVITIEANGAGTYYAAMLPTACPEGFHVSICNGSEILGQKFTAGDFSFERCGLYNLGSVGTGNITANFVTPEGAGTKDGNSWDNAAAWSAFRGKFAAEAVTGDIFMAGGTYAITGPTVKANSNFHIYGGFDPASTGMDLSKRDIAKFETIIDGEGTQRHFVWNNSTSDDSFDGITFQNALKNSTDVGCSIIANNCKSLSFNNCVFKNNKKTNTGGGTMRVAKGNLKFTNCEFTGNDAAGNAGVFAVTGAATLTLENCIFAGNKCGGSASALYLVNAAYTVTVNHCYFLNNTSGNKGVICAGHQDGKLYMNGCSFHGNTTGEYASVLYAKGKTAVLNCCFDANTTTTSVKPATIWTDINIDKEGNPLYAYTLIANSTVRLDQGNAFGVLVENSPIWAVNSIVTHTAAADSAAVKTTAIMTSYGHNICSTLNAAPDTYVIQDPAHIDVLANINQTWTDGILTWSNWNGGTRPTGFTLATQDRVLEAIEAFDTAAGTTVKDMAISAGFVGEDIRGIKRNPTAFWPGSYDEGATITLN